MITRSITSFRFGVLVLAFALCAPLAFGQMPQGNAETLSSEEVSDEQIQKVARILVATRMSTRDEQMQMRKDMKEKYGNPQEMDSTQKAQARREMRKKQMAMRKKQQKVMQQKAQEEGMDPQMVQKIARSAQQDSTLGERIQKAMKQEMQNQQPQMQQNPNQ